MKRPSKATSNHLGFIQLTFAIFLLTEHCAFSETNAPDLLSASVAVADHDSDFDGIPDNSDPFPIIASYSVFKWEINSASLDYDVQQTRLIDSGSSSANSATKSIKGSFSWAIGADGKIEAGIHGSAGLNANPFKGFGLSAGLNVEGGVSALPGQWPTRSNFWHRWHDNHHLLRWSELRRVRSGYPAQRPKDPGCWRRDPSRALQH